MRYGGTITPQQLPRLADLGFDFAEMAVHFLAPESPEEELAPLRDQLQASPVKVEAWNVLLPSDLKITGPRVDHARVSRYLYTALARISAVGGKLVVFGSGGARRAPDGFPLDRAREQVLEFLEFAAEMAMERDLTIAIEPLHREADNLINTIAQAVALAREAAHPRVRVLADNFLSLKEEEPLEEVTRAGPWLAHIHICNGQRRPPGTGGADPRPYLAAAKQAGYDGRVSIEASWEDFEAEAAGALRLLREFDG